MQAVQIHVSDIMCINTEYTGYQGISCNCVCCNVQCSKRRGRTAVCAHAALTSLCMACCPPALLTLNRRCHHRMSQQDWCKGQIPCQNILIRLEYHYYSHSTITFSCIHNCIHMLVIACEYNYIYDCMTGQEIASHCKVTR